ncbi:LysR family transcriptional regulator [Rodentibacter mrazii]|uniref:LysR family transcriptional regulator n=1 Tax=Rodentibacter mrazii TaxID=1908257 RepID=A0A1V3IJU4_9PAST|nr:LysR family transcriptional regulator [Rodentibacter mrazii]OOF41683.1 LysR family transcriptional regulator [Rodentibacter mrazii]
MIDNINELRTFIVAAQQGSFTKAAAKLGVSTSALSHAIRKLEEQLNIKLFNRTTRSIATTEAGEQLFQNLLPLFESIEDNINALSTFRNTLSGKLRINGNDHAFLCVIWDKLMAFMTRYPEVELELTSDLKFVDIVSGRFDAGIRLGHGLQQDMIAVKIADDMQMGVFATPHYLAQHNAPKALDDLNHHRCICVKIPSMDGVMQWEFMPKGKNRKYNPNQVIKWQPKGQLLLNNSHLVKQAVISGQGLAWIAKNWIYDEIERGELVEVLVDYAVHYDGYYLYYPNRRQDSPLFKALVDCLKMDK